MVYLTDCFCQVTYVFRMYVYSGVTLLSEIWVTAKILHLNIPYRKALTIKFSHFVTFARWLNVSLLSYFVFKSRFSYLVFRYSTFLEQVVLWRSGNFKVRIDSKCLGNVTKTHSTWEVIISQTKKFDCVYVIGNPWLHSTFLHMWVTLTKD